MKSVEIRQRFLKFFEKRGHSIIPSASLVPENDPSVLFNTAGMQPLVPYLLGEKHPLGVRLANCQKCVRTVDIDDIGDNTHATFFEMLGNWSLGDYFKDDAISWSYQFLTSKEEGLGLDPKRLYITVFEGDENAPRDNEALEIWKKVGVPENRIYFLPAKNNWWSAGDNGPCGPDSEMFYDVTPEGLGDLTHEQFLKADERREVVEIWNDVFMQYEKKDGKIVGKLAKKNIDTGSGLERVAMVVQGVSNIYDTDLLNDLMLEIGDLAMIDDLRSKRIVADHLRTATFMIADGVLPSNSDRGYILRRILRRAVRYCDKLGVQEGVLGQLSHTVINNYEAIYSNLKENEDLIKTEIAKEENKFRKTLIVGLKEFSKLSVEALKTNNTINGKDAFVLFSSFGFPIDMTVELAKEKGLSVDMKTFDEEMKKHQDLSRVGSEQKFKGGLAGNSDVEIRYHTATHLLNASLRKVLGDHIMQKGSNINTERMRFDFSHPNKMTDEEKKKVEDLVNQKIEEGLPVTFKELPKEEALKLGAMHAFGEKYGDIVKVYIVGDENKPKDDPKGVFSMEFCGGPHVENTKTIGKFKILKEEAVSQGVRRIKAVVL